VAAAGGGEGAGAAAQRAHEAQELLAAAGRYASSRIRGTPVAEPLSRWRAEHAHDGEQLSQGREMHQELSRRLELVEARKGPYLYRHISAGVSALTGAGDPVAEAITDCLCDAEQRGIADGLLKSVGLRLVARAAVRSA
jgi:hypothetical protein